MNRAAMVLALWMTVGVSGGYAAEGDPDRGAKAFRQCAACHSMQPGRHLTGPSLADMVGRKAATVEGFSRYTAALQQSGLSWDRASLDRWLANPQALVPGTAMRVQGIADAGMRADLIAFIKAASTQGTHSDDSGGMMGGRLLNLKSLTPQQVVAGIRHCGDTYHVTLGTGNVYAFWEFNLRFKTDSSTDGPEAGKPAIVRAGMRGDRAQVVFAAPAEISAFIQSRCVE